MVESEKKKIEAKLKEVRERVKKEEEEVLTEKKKMPKNVDTLSSAGFSKTIVNTASKPKYEESGGDNLEELKKSLGDIEKQAAHA